MATETSDAATAATARKAEEQAKQTDESTSSPTHLGDSHLLTGKKLWIAFGAILLSLSCTSIDSKQRQAADRHSDCAGQHNLGYRASSHCFRFRRRMLPITQLGRLLKENSSTNKDGSPHPSSSPRPPLSCSSRKSSASFLLNMSSSLRLSSLRLAPSCRPFLKM